MPATRLMPTPESADLIELTRDIVDKELRPLADVDPAAKIPGRGLARRYLRTVRGQRIARTRTHVLR